MIDRNRLTFEYFFNAGIDRERGIIDGEGTDICELDENGVEHYIGSLYGYHPMEVSEMTDEELEQVMKEHGIFTNRC